MRLLSVLVFLIISGYSHAQSSTKKKSSPLQVIAYYSGNESQIDGFAVEKLTHIIYSFCHLKGDRLNVDDARDSATIKKLVSLKQRNPKLSVMLSLGGWGGCQPCSDVFTSDDARKSFASSVKQLCDYFGTDGIDLDWEYPAIEGHPGHPYRKEDRPNFTSLVKSLRDSLGKKREISFAAGGFDDFLQQSVEWSRVMPLVDRVNLMSYDLVNGFSTSTGHHTSLYATERQRSSADDAIRNLEKLGVPANKIVIGAAFYGRTWINVADSNNGLYQSGTFKSFVPYHRFDKVISADSGYVFHYDKKAMASYAFHPTKGVFATFDNRESIRKKTRYAREHGLNGIMFWELTLDKTENGLLDVIFDNKVK